MVEEPGVEAHFIGKDPHVRAIYEKLLLELRRFGPVIEDPKRTSIHLVNQSAFAGVVTRKTTLLLNIKTAEPIESPRFARLEQVSTHRYHQELKLGSPQEVDGELLGWLSQAYTLSA